MDTQNIISIISLLIGGGSIGGAAVYIFNFKSKKKVEKASATLATAQADSQVGENWRKYAEKQEQKTEQLEYKVDEMNKKLTKMSKLLSKVFSQKGYAEYHLCKKVGCTERDQIGRAHV